MNIDILNSKNLKVYSFDIFDTLITRRTATPLGIFAIMQEKLKNSEKYNSFSTYFKNNFALLRHKTEFWERDNVFRNCTGAQDITFDEIYSLLQKNQSLSDEQIHLLKELEIQTEKDNLVAIVENVNTLKQLKKEGKEIILISDMYFSSNVLKDIMINIDPIFCDIDIFTSADTLKSKYFGDLYKFVKNKKGYDFNKWIHIDDSKHNIAKAGEFGIDGALVKFEKEFDINNYILSDIDEVLNMENQAILGSIKLATKYRTEGNKIFDFGASYVGPILFGYANWLINQALDRKINHLYFIARDSYLTMQIAQEIVKSKNLDIKLHYLYGSRKAWRFATRENVVDHIKTNFMEYQDRITLKFLADRLELPVEKLILYSGVKAADKVFSLKKLKKIETTLQNNPEFINEIVKNGSKKEEMLVKYLKQEIDFSKNDFAFVEINGSGRTQDYLQKITKKFYADDLTTFYMHLTTDSARKESSVKIPYCPLSEFNTQYLEIFSTDFNGRTIDYKEENGRIVPVFEKEKNYQIIDFGYHNCVDGALAFSKCMLEFEFKNNVSLSGLFLYLKYYNYLNYNLDKTTAEILGSFPFNEMGEEKNIKQCAPPYSWFDVLKFALLGEEKKLYAAHFISIVRSSKSKQKIIKKVYKRGSVKKNIGKITKNIFSITNKYSATGRKKIFTILGLKLSISMTKPSFYKDIHYLCTFLKFLSKKRKKEKLTKIDKIRFITYREPLYKGGGGGQGAAMTMNKLILPEEFKNIPIEYTFEVPNKYLRDKNHGPNVEFSGIKFAIDETKNDKNVIYVTHEEATAFGLWLMGKNYIMFSHLQGARAEESKNFGYKFSKLSENIIKFCEATAMKNAYSVSFVSEGAYKYFCNSKFRGLDAKDFNKGPIVYNTLYVENEPEQYKDLKYDPNYLTILTSGSLTTAKGVDRTLELVEKMCSKTDRKIRHIFIGEGVMQNFVETKLAEISQKYPNFSYITVSRCSDGNMPYLQSICDVFIVLHRIAIFDLSTLEIMNKAKAIVLSDVGGNPEFNVEDNIIMWSEEKQNYDEVADKILNSDLGALGQKNKEVYKNYFGHKPYKKAYMELLSNFINSVEQNKEH